MTERATCAQCNEPVTRGQRFCPNCGTELEWLAGANSGVVPEGNDDERTEAATLPSVRRRRESRNARFVCPDCGAVQDPSESQCDQCGASLEEVIEPVADDEEFERAHQWFRQQGWTITQVQPGGRAGVVVVFQRPPPPTIIHEYESTFDYQWESEWLAEDGWRVSSTSVEEQRSGCLRYLLLGILLAFIFRPKAHLIVTYERVRRAPSELRRGRPRRYRSRD